MNEMGYHDRYPAVADQLWVPCPKWVRAYYNGIAIADSRQAMLWRGRPAIYYFPRTDVRLDLLLPTDHTTRSDLLGTATYWTLTVGSKSTPNAAWTYSGTPENAPHLKGYIAIAWHAMDAWYEEDELIRVGPRDPYTRLDALQSSRSVRIAISGITVADTSHPVLLFETGKPTRYYIPRIDVRTDLLEPGSKIAECPYKGTGACYHFHLGDTLEENVAWSFHYPNPNFALLKDKIAFYPQRTSEFLVDGRQLPPPPI